ncbi:hypothetical protein Sru01_54110 [Sphaerisporangium rufum]|uniref:Glycoprotein n=1 Tax=Sphaerisporangium rufum TaxID=1381558 RepID=A0A919V258_9ACTN|nr:DUF6049 family protein [Sphaerisporangium rufum]GII80429.1 hypothetical protein Sru01_54110 [Sphaerisporangium rufum]
MTRGAALVSVLAAACATAAAALCGAPAADARSAAGAPATAQAVSAPVPGQAARRQVAQISIDSVSPQAPRDPDQPIKISGTVTNTGSAPLSWISIRLRFSRSAFTDRAQMQAFADGGQVLDQTKQSRPLSQLPAAGKAAFEFTTSPAELGITGFRFGVYPLTVELVDTAARQLAAQRTFLPYAQRGVAVSRTRVSFALPLIDQPHRGADLPGQAGGSADEVFLDEGLREAVAAGGRLDDLLKIAEAPGKGVTWFVDPALLDEASAMAQGYRLRSKDGTTARPGDRQVAEWLRRMREALADRTVAATPYADPDVAAAAHNGLEAATRTALDKGATVASALLGREIGTTVGWPAGGVVDHDGLDALAMGGVRTVLLAATALPPQPPVTFTPNAAATLETVRHEVKVLLADPLLGQLFGGATAPDTPALAAQRFLAETAMISAEPGGGPRGVVVAPARRWSPDPAYVTALLKSAGSAPWLRPAGLGSIKAADEVPRGPLTYTDKDRQAELDRSYLTKVRRLGLRAEVTATVTDDHRQIFDTALLNLASSAWRGRIKEAGPLFDQVDAAVTERTEKVSVNTVTQRTLAGDNGVVPISIRNDLAGQDVELGVRITSGNERVLEIGRYESQVKISPGKTKPIDIPMIAHRAGSSTTVKVQLTTADGLIRYGKPVSVTVRVTGYTAITLWIVGAGLTVMLAAVVLRVLRRHARRPAKGRRAAPPEPVATVPEPARNREGPS